VPHWYRLLSEAGFAEARVDVGSRWNPVERALAFIQATA